MVQAVENIALRQRLALLHRNGKRRRLRQRNRVFWAWLCKLWTDWRSALVIVEAATAAKWSRRQ